MGYGCKVNVFRAIGKAKEKLFFRSVELTEGGQIL